MLSRWSCSQRGKARAGAGGLGGLLLLSVVVMALAFMAAGCSEVGRSASPVRLQTIGMSYHYLPPTVATNDPLYFRTAYDAASTNSTNQIRVRSTVAYELMQKIDEEYASFEKNLRSDRAYVNVMSAWASLGLSTAGTVFGAAELKTILSATDTGLKGATTSLSKEAFEEKTTEVLINQMRASRSKISAEIFTGINQTNTTAAYPLSALLRDLQRYYAAGSVTEALTELANASGSQAATNAAAAAVIRGVAK